MIQWRTPYDGLERSVSDAVSANTNCVGESLTVQSQAEDADINVLMRKYGITGRMPENPRVPMYGDFTEIRDYKSALEALAGADEAFMSLPAEVRARFDNNPQLLLEFVHDANNASKVREIFGERVASVTGKAVGADVAASGGGAQGDAGAAAGSAGAASAS